MDPVIVGISGASGSILAKRTIEMLINKEIPVVMTCTAAARMVWQEEMDETFNGVLARWGEFPDFTYYPIGDLKAPIASGTMPTSGMIVTPCSVGTVAAIANGLAANLLQRSADVCIKEKRKLILVPRETPLSSIHLENMLRISNLGVVILPPVPAFYLKPRSVEDIVEYIVAKTIDSLGLSGFMDDDLRYQRSTE